MRSLHLLWALVLTTTLLHGQLRQGDLLLTPSSGNTAFLSTSPLAISGNAASISSASDEDGLVVAFLPTVGYALTDNLVAGLGVNIVVGRDTERDSDDGLSPYFRYYFVNKKWWHLYGGGRATFIFTDSDTRRSGSMLLKPTFGLGVALDEGIFFSPELSKALNRSGSPVDLELKFDILVNNRRSRRSTIPNRYNQGNWMLGTRLGGLRIATAVDNRSSVTLSPEAHYFVIDQLAFGLEAGTTLRWEANGPTQSSAHGGLSVRYVPVHDQEIDLFGQVGIHFESAGGALPERIDPDGGVLFHTDGSIGALFFPRKYFALEFGLGVAHYPAPGFTEMAFSGGVRIFPRR